MNKSGDWRANVIAAVAFEEKNSRLTEPHWHNGKVCWFERKQPDGSWERCEQSIGKKANKLRDGVGGWQGGRGYREMRRTCWSHQAREQEAQALPLRKVES